MINLGVINSGSTLGIPFKILGVNVATVRITVGKYNQDGDFVILLGPDLSCEVTNQDGYSIVFIDGSDNISDIVSERYFYLKVKSDTNKDFVINGKYSITPLPYSEESEEEESNEVS